MLTGYDRNWRALERAVEVAISRNELKPAARHWGKVDLLEEMAHILGVAPTKLRNQYYRNDSRLELLLLSYAATETSGAIASLQALEFRSFSPLVWKRPREQLKASKQTLPNTLELVRVAEEQMRKDRNPPIELRREVGTVAAEVMACALTFFDGDARWSLLREGDELFRSAMGFLMLGDDATGEDAVLLARFWENKASPCGLEWSNIWDDPRLPPVVGDEIVELAISELQRAIDWMEWRNPERDGRGRRGRVRQFAADKAKWLAKAGRFDEAWRQLDRLDDKSDPALAADQLLLAVLEFIARNQLDDAARAGSRLAELLREEKDSIAPVTASIMVHNIDLMRERPSPPSEEITEFLRESPVAGSEHVNLPRYRRRLREHGYAAAAA